MTLIDTASILDPSTALGAVLSWLLAVFPAGLESTDIWQMSQTAFLFGFGGALMAAGILGLFSWRPAMVPIIEDGTRMAMLIGVVLLLADAGLAAEGLPRISWGALPTAGAFIVGGVGGSAAYAGGSYFLACLELAWRRRVVAKRAAQEAGE